MPALFLVGMMGSGKTTVGRLLARRRRACFVDLDQRLETIFGRSIADLVRGGEPRFRVLERAVLRHLLSEPGFPGVRWVVATGGGVVADPANVEDMARAGTIVFLDVPVEELVRRLRGDRVRPLLAGALDGAERIAELLAERRQGYGAGIRVDGTGAPEEVADRILALW